MLTVATTYAATTTFTDEASFASWYKDAVKHMQETGVVTGYADNTFKPENPVTRGELSLMLDRYEEKIVDQKIAEAMAGNSGGMTESMVDKKIADYFLKYQGSYFDNHIEKVIDNTLAFESKDYNYKTLLIMAESGIKYLSKAPAEKLVQKEANLPQGYTLYQEVNDGQIQDEYYPPFYLNYKGEETNFMGESYLRDEWYGPFSSYPY